MKKGEEQYILRKNKMKFIKKLREMAYRIVLNDQTNFEMLLLESNDICSHLINIQTLMTDAYKIQNNLAPPIMESTLEKKAVLHNLRSSQEFVTQTNRQVN